MFSKAAAEDLDAIWKVEKSQYVRKEGEFDRCCVAAESILEFHSCTQVGS